MRKVCPQCQGSFAAQFLCPNCGVQLLDVSGRATTLTVRGGPEDDARPAGMATRFVAGLLLAQGTYFGIRLIGSAFFLATGEADGWASAPGHFGNIGSMVIAALLGGLLAGAGNPRGLAAGASLGLLHALALIGIRFAGGQWPDSVMLYFGWAALVGLGAFGGRLGRRIWPPLSDLTGAAAPAAPAGPARPAEPREPTPPTAWFRVLGGAALSIGCTVWAGSIRDFVIGTSHGSFSVESRLQAQFITWVISALAMMVGGVFAGASTRRGLRHGLLVGLLSSIGVFVIHSQIIKEGLPAELFFGAVLGLPEMSGHTPQRLALFLACNSLAIGTFGGWVGATMFPRVGAGPSRLDRGAI